MGTVGQQRPRGAFLDQQNLAEGVTRACDACLASARCSEDAWLERNLFE